MKSREANGFTLLETLAAMFVLSVGILAVLRVYDVGARELHVSSEYEVALRAISNELDTLRAFPDRLPAPGEHVFTSQTPEVSGLYLAETNLRVEPAGTAPGVAEVTARVSWITEAGRRVDREVTTAITRNSK